MHMHYQPPACCMTPKGTGQLAPGGHCCTYAVRVPAPGVLYVPPKWPPPQVKRFATLPPDACLAPPLVAVWRNVEAESERYQVRLLGSAAGQLDTVHPRG